MAHQRGIYHPDIRSTAPRSSHIFLLLAILLLATVPLIAAAEPSPPAASPRVAVTTTDALYLRECPSLTCRTVSSEVLGETLEVTGEAVDGFLPVRAAECEGWAYRLFLSHQGDRPLMRKGVLGCDRVALIFNTGMGEQPSETILTTLTETQAPVTVFAMGWWAEAYPDYLHRLDESTRAVFGSHGDTQTFPTDAADTEVMAEVRNSATAIGDVLGYPTARYYTAYASDTDARVESIITAGGTCRSAGPSPQPTREPTIRHKGFASGCWRA